MFAADRLFRNVTIVLGSLTFTPLNKGDVSSNDAILPAPLPASPTVRCCPSQARVLEQEC